VALVAVALSLSRGGYLATALGAAVLLFLLPQVRKGVLLAAVPCVIGLALVATFSPETPTQLIVIGDRLGSFSGATANPEDDRVVIWQEAVRQIENDPWTGSGPGNFPVVASRAGTEVSFVAPAHAHDVPLTLAAESGLPAAAVLVLLTARWARQFIRTSARLRDPRDRALAASLAAASATFVGQGLFDSTMGSSVVLILLATCVGLALAVGRTAP
jgi:O-antigen ligase